nr:MAG TPA: hypothetical protein [Caudoviricetes sp.]
MPISTISDNIDFGILGVFRKNIELFSTFSRVFLY